MGKKKRFQPETEKQEENKQSNEVFNGDCDSEEPKRKKKKKQKRSQSETEHQEQTKQSNEVFNGDANTEEPKRTKKKKKNKHHSEEIKVIPTVSIAIPSSIIGNAQSDELATRVCLLLLLLFSFSSYPFLFTYIRQSVWIFSACWANCSSSNNFSN